MRPPIYKKRSLGEQVVRVEKEDIKWCDLGHWLWSMSHHKPNILEARLSFLPYKASWARKLGTPLHFVLKDTYSTKITSETKWCLTPKVCALLLVILWGMVGVEVMVGESYSGPRSWVMLLVVLLRGWAWSVGAFSPRSSSASQETRWKYEDTLSWGQTSLMKMQSGRLLSSTSLSMHLLHTSCS